MNSTFGNLSRIITVSLFFVIAVLVLGCSSGCSKGGGTDNPILAEGQEELNVSKDSDAMYSTRTLDRFLNSHDWTKKSNNPKYVILIIGDGMQAEHEIATSRYLYGTDNDLSFHRFPYKAFCTTWDVDTYDRYAWDIGYGPYDETSFIPPIGYNVYRGGWAGFPWCPSVDDSYFLTKLDKWGGGGSGYPATDSASAATAMSTGYKTDAGNIAWKMGDPFDGALETIHETAREKLGMAMGVVSTVPFNHATPAAFVSHNVYRNNYTDLAREIIYQTIPDVVIGGGHPNWNPGYITHADYEGLKTHSNYFFVERNAGVNGGNAIRNGALGAINQRKGLFGFYGGPGGNFEPPIPMDGTVGFTFEEENPQLDEAAFAALHVLSTNKNGFILTIEQGDIDWANHANDFGWMIGTTYDLHKTVETVVNLVNRPFDEFDWTNTLVIVTSDHSNSYMRLVEPLGQGELPTQVPDGGSFIYPDGEVTYGCGSHTNELVSLYAMGAGADLFRKYEGDWYRGTKLVDNTHIYNVIADFLNL